MIKKIKLADIKNYSIEDTEPYEILHASSSSDSIFVYFNEFQRIKVFHKDENMYEYEFEEIIEKENTIHGCNKKLYFFLSFYTLVLILYPITLLLIICSSLSIHSEYVFLMSFFFGGIITSIISLIILFGTCITGINRIKSFSLNSNHTAEHMICDFITRKHRLPKNMDELRRAHLINPCCSTYKFINQDYLTVITNMFFTLMVSIACTGFLIYLGLPMILSPIYCTYLFLVLYIICYKKQIHMKHINRFLTKLGSYFLQYTVITTKNVTDESLIMAYIAGSHWFKMTHFEEFDDDSYISFLSCLNVSVHECEEINQP